jgi:hypothetical protein
MGARTVWSVAVTAIEIHPARCPLCGQDNKCGMVAGASKCWCFNISLASAALARLPPDAEGVACVCEACASGKTEPDPISIKVGELLRGRR